jgi:hypothetical protein
VLLQPWPIGVLVGMAALVGTDLAVKEVRDFWTDHAMVTGIATSLLFVALAVAIIDAWAKEASLATWQRVANISYKALQESLIDSRDGLVMLVAGKMPYPRSGREPDPRCEEVHAIVERQLPRQAAGHADRREHLEVLMQHQAWIDIAFSSVRDYKEEARRVLAHWAPLMLNSGQLAHALNRVALIADALDDLQRPLHPIHRVDGCIAPERRRTAAELWDLTVTWAVLLEEDLVSELRRTPWSSRARELLTDDGRKVLEQRDRRDTGEASDDALTALRDAVRLQYRSSHEVAFGSTAGTEPDAPVR